MSMQGKPIRLNLSDKQQFQAPILFSLDSKPNQPPGAPVGPQQKTRRTRLQDTSLSGKQINSDASISKHTKIILLKFPYDSKIKAPLWIEDYEQITYTQVCGTVR